MDFDAKVKKISSNQLEIEVEIPAAQANIYFDLAASELSKDMKVKGFRPGKVPADIVEREKGSQKLYDQAANLAIQKTLPKAILDNKLEVVGQPDIIVLQIARGNPMKYKATFWTIPEVELGNYNDLEIKKKEIKVEDEEIDKSLEYLQKSRAKLITISRSAKKGDRVEIDFFTRIGGAKVENGEGKNHPVILGESRFMPGFEEKLEGMNAGEEKEFFLKAPEDWPQKNLSGKNLNFRVKMNLIQEREIPKLSDDFAKSLGKFESIDKLRKNIREGLAQEKEAREKERIRMELIEKIAKDSKMDIPQALIEIELDRMINELQDSVQSMGLDFNKYLQEIKKTADDLRKGWYEQAEKRTRIGLTLRAIAEKEKIEVSDDEVIEKINGTLKHHPGTEEAKKNIDLPAFKEYTKNVIRNEKVFELLEREATLSGAKLK